MSVILPSSVNYRETLPALPEGVQSINVATSPVNGQIFSSGQQIIFDFLNRGMLVPDSIYISYTYTNTKTDATHVTSLIGCPVYSSFSRVDVQIGSMTVESINNYNILMNMLSNLTLSVSDKYGLQTAFGYRGPTNTPNEPDTPSLEQFDGAVWQAGLGPTQTGSFSAPLMTMISNSEKMLPLFAMPQLRLILTVDSIENMFLYTGVLTSQKPANWQLSNVELRYKVVDMGGNVEEIIRGMGEKIYIKSQSFATSSNTLNGGTPAGSYELIYNMRFASIKSLFAIMGNGIGNKQFDSVDLSNSTGDYYFIVGGQNYPQKPLSARTNKAGILQELRQAIGSIYDKNNSLSINTLEFGRSTTAADTTIHTPGKFYVGVSVEKINSNSLLTGISTQNSPLSFRISTGGSIGANASTITLCVNYDALIEVDLVNRQCSVKT